MDSRRRTETPLYLQSVQSLQLTTSAGIIPYTLRRSARRRTMEIALTDALEVRVTVPRHAPDQAVREFLLNRAEWITRHLHEKTRACAELRQRRYASGHAFLFLGEKYPLTVEEASGRRGAVSFDGRGWRITVPQAEAPRQETYVKTKLTQWYREQAGEVLGGRVFHYVRRMGLEPRTIAVRQQKRIWGSCHPGAKALFFSWQIVLAPLEVLDYVVVHELAHLKEANHSRRFWAVVAGVLPDYRRHEHWLKAHQAEMLLT